MIRWFLYRLLAAKIFPFEAYWAHRCLAAEKRVRDLELKLAVMHWRQGG